MGSFNVTCFASHQTIGPRDKARLMPIMRQATYNPVELTFGDKTDSEYGYAHSICYANALWTPVGSFIPATYDDSLGFKLQLDDNASKAKVLEFFLWVLRTCAKVAAGENEMRESAFDFEAFAAEKTPRLLELLKGQRKYAQDVKGDANGLEGEMQTCWDQVADVIREGRLFGRSYRGDLRPIALASLHEHAYQDLVTVMEAGKDWDGQPAAIDAFVRRTLATARQELTERTGTPDVEMQEFFFADHVAEALARVASESHISRVPLMRVIRVRAKEAIAGTDADDDIVARLMPYMRDRYAYAGLEHYNVRLSPLQYAGHDYDNGIGKAFASFVQRVSKKVSADRKREMD